MIDPSSILPSFYFKTISGEWSSDTYNNLKIGMIFEDLFNSSVQASGSAGIAGDITLTHNFGPHELINEFVFYNRLPNGGTPNFRRSFFKGPNVVGSPYMFGFLGSVTPPS
jgi:hypothetical protein